MQPESHASAAERNPWAAFFRGWGQKCPSCGEGSLFASYLKVRDHCSSCGEELHHHRADDGPAWATIIITGHLLAPLMIMVFLTFQPPAWLMASGLSFGFVLLSLYLLPRLKGVFVGVQWAHRMHGFGGTGPGVQPGP